MSAVSILVMSAAAFAAQPQGVILDFTASWCSPCQQMSPIVSRLKRQGYAIKKVDIDHEPQLARKFAIKSIPSFVLVVNGKEVQRHVGLMSESRLRQWAMQIPTESQQNIVSTPSKRSVPITSKPPRPEPLVSKADQQVTAKNKPTKRSGFQFPFFGRKKETNANSLDDAVVRAKNDGAGDFASSDINVDPLAYCVRIRVKDTSGVNFGSGTIIDSRPGRTLILTCGHILRDTNESSIIEVDIFLGDRFETFVGNSVRYNTEADVGLIAIPTDVALPASPVASISRRPEQGNHVFSLGCGGGKPPTKQQLRVTALNRYLGPDNIECTGVPVQGRSGGGLFNLDGEVVGVCIAADPRDKRGLYAGLKAVHNLLDRSDLSHLYQRRHEENLPDSYHDRPRIRPSTEPAVAASEFPANRASEISLDDSQSSLTSEVAVDEAVHELQSHTAVDPKTMDQFRDALKYAGEAEIVCIIRPLNNPNGASRVVIINRASSKFVADLTGELDAQTQPTTAQFRDSYKTAGSSVDNRPIQDSSSTRTSRYDKPKRPSVETRRTETNRTKRNRFQSDSGRYWPLSFSSSTKTPATSKTPSRYRRASVSR